MRLLLAIALVAFGLSACSSTNGLPPLSSIKPDSVQQGTLANQALVSDATAAVYQLNGGKKPIARFVIQQPVGTVGKMAWRESWIYDPEGAKIKYILTFEEDGTGSASYEIGTM